MQTDIMFEKSHEKKTNNYSISRYTCSCRGTLLLPGYVLYLTALDTDMNRHNNARQTTYIGLPVHEISENLGGVLCNILPEALT